MLVIGAGKMARETFEYLTDAGTRKITVLNRDFARAKRLPPNGMVDPPPGKNSTNGSSKPIWLSAPPAPIGTSSPLPTSSSNLAQAQQRPLFVLDLAMPRDFDPAIGHELGVYLYGIDDLTEACEQNRRAHFRLAPRRRTDHRSGKFSRSLPIRTTGRRAPSSPASARG